MMRHVVAIVLSVGLAGCSTVVPYTGQGPHPQLSRGRAFFPVDAIGNVLIAPMKLLLWDWRIGSHTVSIETEATLTAYLSTQQQPMINDTHFQLNEYNPATDIKRLIKNKHVKWPYRILLGIPTTLISDVLLPGRLFPWGDYYNPFTNTVHLFSDHPAITLHEAGHAHDTAGKKYKGTYAAIRMIPFVDLLQEAEATKEAIAYLKQTDDLPTELRAYKILYPAFGSYVGQYIFPPIGTLGAVLIGHASGRTTAANVAKERALHPLPQQPSGAAP